MAWFKVDDKLHSHPKRHMAGLRAMGLWVAAGSWSSDQLTDGHIPRHMLHVLGGKPSDAKALVEAGLWKTCPDGYQFHDWSEMNPSRADVTAVRDAERKRKQAWREKAKRDSDSGQFASAES